MNYKDSLLEYKLCIVHTSVAEPISSESYQDLSLDGENDRMRSLPSKSNQTSNNCLHVFLKIIFQDNVHIYPVFLKNH